MRGPGRRVAAVLVLVAAALLSTRCGGGSATGGLGSRLLSAGDLPAGWSAAKTGGSAPRLTNAPCLSGLPAHPKGWTYATAGFVQGVSVPNAGEVVAAGAQARAAWRRFDRALAGCRTATLVLGGTRVRVRIHALAFPRVGSRSSAYAWAFTLAGVRIGFDLVLFDAGSYSGYLTYADLGRPDAATVHAFAKAAVSKAETGATRRVAAGSIVSAPVRTARTRLGSVSYRAVGSGPPLLLITGYGGTIEGWDRRFVDALAKRRRVVVFDNAGVGGTEAVPGPLTVDAMAGQTAALIDALGLRRPDVLGWSMGGMVAQALAVLHPDRVRRLVLCATFPGTGDAVRPSRAAIEALTSGDSKRVLADLFPADRGADGSAYVAALSSYPAAKPAPAAVVAAQGRAVDAWWSGDDPAGRRTAAIAAPTLVADGTADRLDPVANSRALAGLIRGATLRLYPDAGHAFLFQDEAAFAGEIESFLR